MTALTERQVRKLQPGDFVYYKERAGQLSNQVFEATVLEKYPRFVLLECTANVDGSTFKTCFNYDDTVEFSGYRLYQ